MVTRVPILDVQPRLEGGLPVKAAVGEEFHVRARVFGEGPMIVRAAVILTGPDDISLSPAPMQPLGDDRWGAAVIPDKMGWWSYAIESWHDPIETWLRDARLKITDGIEVELTLLEGALLLAQIEPALAASDLADLSKATLPADERMELATALAQGHSIRQHLGTTESFPVYVDRERALYGSWYEMFPRSDGATLDAEGAIVPGTFATAIKRLDEIAAMGFDVVYLPPIHPIGTQGRKGRNNSLTALPGNPGSPWAVGAREGGHDTVHPELGTLEDFEAFVIHAASLGLEVALDLALQCSPDHPWVRDHPEWFTMRADGTIAFDENPPRRNQDVYPLTFDNDQFGLYREIRWVIRHWMTHGVRVFRVHRAHAQPLLFWERLLADIRKTDPEVIFLADAITAPATIDALAMVGFHQSYTAFTQHEHPADVAAFLDEVANDTSDSMRPNLFVNTPDILPTYLQAGDVSMFKMRAALAATGSPSWGMYAGYELLEHQALARGSQEYLFSEKFEIKVRNWDSPDSIAPYITKLNEIRRRHPALQRLRNLEIVKTDHLSIVAFTKITGPDVVVVVIDLRPSFEKSVRLDVNLISLGLQPGASWRDELDGTVCTLDGVPISDAKPARILVPV